jgi:hypothetical protein
VDQVESLRTVEVGEAGELVHHADHAAVGRSGQPVFEGLYPFGLDGLRGDSGREQHFGDFHLVTKRDAGLSGVDGAKDLHRLAGGAVHRRTRWSSSQQDSPGRFTALDRRHGVQDRSTSMLSCRLGRRRRC